MRVMMKFLPPVIFGIASLFSAPAMATDYLSERQRVDLFVFSARAMGLKVTSAEVKNPPPMSEIPELVSTGLNIGGHLCAKVVKVSPLRAVGTYEVSCIAYRGGSAMKSYAIDSNSGRVEAI